MKDQSLNIFSLEISINLLSGNPNIDSFKPAEISFLSRAHNLFLSYYPAIHDKKEVPSLYEDFSYFIKNKDLNDLRAIADLLSHPQENSEGEKNKKVKEPEKETSSIPAELETMVALYKEHQADLLDSEDKLSVADTIKRARKAWSEREKHRLIYENASAEKQNELDQQKEKFYRQTVNPKEQSRQSITSNTRNLAAYALTTFSKNLNASQYQEVVEKIVYLAETGSIDITNINDLYIASSLAVKDILNIQTELDQIDNLAQKQLEQEVVDPYSEKVDQYDKELKFANQEAESSFRTKTQKYTEDFRHNKDYDILIDSAEEEIHSITEKLSNAIPNAKLQFQSNDLEKKAAELEKLVRQINPSALNINSSGLGARTSATLKETGGNTKISAPLVDLYSKGLTKEKLDELEKDPRIKDFYKKTPNLQKYVQNGIKRIQKSKFGEELNNELRKMGKTGEFISHLPSGVQKLLHPVDTAKSFINKKIGQYAGKQIIKHSSSAVGKKLGNFILEHGLKEGAKQFADAVAKKVLIAAAQKAGVSAAKAAGMVAAESAIAAASVALGISTAGLSLIIEAGILVVTAGFALLKKGVDEIRRTLGSTKEEDQKNRKALLIGLGALASTLFAAKQGVKMFGTATKAAVISAVGIIWLSLATIAVFLTLTFLVAPILTTLVQFDAVEKVKYGELADDMTAKCNGSDLKNDKKTCSGSYCFPINDTKTVSYLEYHHDYPANDIMRIGDKPGKEDDIPLPLLAYTSGYVINATDDPIGGLSLIIAGDDGKFYYYAHNMCNTVTSGQRVEAGTIVGGMDTSGNADGYLEHLHFHISTSPDMRTVPENYPNFIWPYEDFCKTLNICGPLNPNQYPELQYL